MMVSWFKHDIPAWMDGTEALDDGAYRVYHVICQLIYLNEGPIALNEHGIAGRCRQHVLKFRTNLQKLINVGKVSLIDGKLSNLRTETELKFVEERRENSAKGGRGSKGVAKGSSGGSEEVGHGLDRGSAEVEPRLANGHPTKSLENNGSHASALLDSQLHKTRLDETREEIISPVAKATRTKQEYSEEFETKFWVPYPRSPTMAKKEAWREWMKLTPEQRVDACQAIEPYKKYLRSKPNLETVHACRFLSQQRFDGFVNSTASPQPALDIRSSLV